MTRAWLQTVRRHFIPLVFTLLGIGFLVLPVLDIYYPAVPMFGNPLYDYVKGGLILLLAAAYELVLRVQRAHEQQYEDHQVEDDQEELDQLFSDYDD